MPERDADRRLGQIEHIVVLMMENRSFDQMLGYLMRAGLPEVRGLTGEETNPDLDGTPVQVRPCDLSEPLDKYYDPCHGADCVEKQLEGLNQGFVRNFVATRNPPEQLEAEYHDLVMRYYTGELLPVYDRLARSFAICDAWHSSIPGDTWPNRLMALSGSHPERKAPPLVHWLEDHLPQFLARKIRGIPLYEAEAFTRRLEDKQWRWYSHDPATLRLADKAYRKFTRRHLHFRAVQRDNFAYFNRRRLSFVTETGERGLVARDSFFDDAAKGELRDVSWIDPNFFDAQVFESDSNDDHPPSSVIAGQALVLEIYQALYKSPNWANTLFVIVYDEHGGFYDHVPPPVVSDDPRFHTLGVRVPALVIGPRVQQQVCHQLFDHTSLIKTILTRFVPPERRDAAIAAMPRRIGEAEHLGVVLGDEVRDDVPDLKQLRPEIRRIIHQMRESRRARPEGPSAAPDGAGRKHEFHDFQEEFLELAHRVRDQGLPPGQP